jgi:hypothetical protein
MSADGELPRKDRDGGDADAVRQRVRGDYARVAQAGDAESRLTVPAV